MTTAPTVPYPGSILLVIVWLAFLAGCGGAGDGFTGPRGKVSGSVTFDGSPVPSGSTIMFQTKEGPTYLATGTVKADGKYELASEGQKGLPAVPYFVQIFPPAGEASGGNIKVAVDPKDLKSFSKDELNKNMSAGKDTKSPFPVKYYSFKTSKLTFNVKEGDNTADFKLEK